MKAIRLAVFLLALSLLPLPAPAIVLGPRVHLPMEWVWHDSMRNQQFWPRIGGLAAASDGTNFMVVWSQYGLTGMVGPDGEPPRQITPGVFALRMDASGNLLDAAPVLISSELPATSFWEWTVGEWVAYAEASDSYAAAWTCENEIEACVVRLSSTGALLDPAPIRLPTAAQPVVTTDGAQHFVLAGNEMFVISADGTWTEFPLAFTAGAVASDGTNLLNVRGDVTLFAKDGTVLNQTAMPPGIPGSAVAFDGSSYAIIGSTGGAASGAWVTRVDTSGAFLDTTRIVNDWYGYAFDISFDGLSEVAAWCSSCVDDKNPVRVAVIRSQDAILSASMVSGASEGVLHKVAVASNATGTSVVVMDGFIGLYSLGFHPAAQFLTTWAPVAVSKSGSGAGTVTSAPAGIDCGPACMGRFEVPAALTLTAAASAGSEFAGWAGACAGTAPSCTLDISAPAEVIASFADAAPPEVQVPEAMAAVATAASGAVVTFTATAHDEVSGDLVPSCIPASGSLFPPGVTHVACSATDAAGNTGSAIFDVEVTFAWSGVLPPVRIDGSSTFKLGRTIPVKFELGGASAGISDLVATLSVGKTSQDAQSSALEIDAGLPDDGNVFRYDPTSGTYIFNLSTKALSAGTWVMGIDLGDGVARPVAFALR